MMQDAEVKDLKGQVHLFQNHHKHVHILNAQCNLGMKL